MEITQRELVTILHGMLFGGFFLLAIFGAGVMLLEWRQGQGQTPSRWETIYLLAMVMLGWAAVRTLPSIPSNFCSPALPPPAGIASAWSGRSMWPGSRRWR